MNEQRLQEARAQHSRGDLAGAISAYDELLAGDPGLADVWHMKALAEHQSGRIDAARASVAKAIAAGGEKPSFVMLEASILHDLGELAGAEERLGKVAQARPDWAAAHMDLGAVRMDMGRIAEALESFRAAVSADPNHARGWNNVGMALAALDRIDDARRAFDHALTLDPRYGLAHFNVARIHNLRADYKRALEHAQFAVASDAANAEAWLLVGDLRRRRRENKAAYDAYRSAVNAAPQHLGARNALADLLAETGHTDGARSLYAEVASHAPTDLAAALGANLLLPPVYSSIDHLEQCRLDFAKGLERLHEAAPEFRFPSPEAALEEARWTNFLLAYQGRDDCFLQGRFGEFQRRVLRHAVPEFFAPRPARAGRARVRVGFLSHFFFNCTVGRYFGAWVKGLDPARFETFVYYTNEWVADDTRAIAAAAGTFRHLAGRSMHAVAQQVAADELDVLVYPEVGMHRETVVLAGLRLAPVQCAGWGHPDTTGLPEMDWFVSCEPMELPGSHEHYNERLAMLPGLGTRYDAPKASAGGTRADYGIPEDRTVYLVPQSLFKIHLDNDALIAQVLERDPRGIALLFSSQHDVVTQAFAARLSAALEARGLAFYERVFFSRPGVPHADYLRMNELADVMLDTVHWSGGNTSLDALASALPVVTMPGSLMRGRQSQAMLKMIGLDELAVPDRAAYVEKAVALGKDPDLRKSLSERIARGRDALFGRDEPIRALQDFLERAARAAA